MTTKIDGKNMNESETVKNDWAEDEDDNWDDWGDAEDNGSRTVEQEQVFVATKNNENAEVITAVSTSPQNCNNNLSDREVNSNNLEAATKSSGWGSWGVWGGVVNSVLSTATAVNQGLNQVIGVPDPEEMARINASEAAKEQETRQTEGAANKSLTGEEEATTTAAPGFGLNRVSGVVTTLGSKVLNTGLDTLEGIGKKTMNILQENDPMLMNKRKLLRLERDQPNLSEILKEAKKDADQLEHTLKELKIEKSRELLRFETLFENNCGLVHLEALEILSKESTLKLQSLADAVSGNALAELQETINEVKELMELEDLEGESDGDYDAKTLKEKLLAAIEDAELPIVFDDIASIWLQSLDWISTCADNGTNEEEAFAKGITALAETCAFEMNKLHKIAELLLVKEHHSTANEVDSIVQLCKQFSAHLNGLTNRFAATLNAIGSEESKTQISTLFSEMLVAMQLIEKAFKLFLPILQIGAV